MAKSTKTVKPAQRTRGECFMPSLLIILLLVVFPSASRLSASNNAGKNDIVEMEKMEITAKRYLWRYARIDDFEILSGLDNDKKAADIIQKTLAIIDVFRERSPLFRMRTELPTKIILLKDPAIEKFITTVNEKLGAQIEQDARTKTTPIKRPEIQGTKSRTYAPNKTIRYLIRGDPEQAQIVMYIPEAYKWRSDAYYAVSMLMDAYFKLCLTSHGIKFNNLSYTFSRAKMLTIDSSERAMINRDEREIRDSDTVWYSLNRSGVLIRRFDYKRERDIFQGLLPDYFKSNTEALSKFLEAPRHNLRDVLEYPETFRINYNDFITARAVDNYITYKRQISDFSIYCALGPSEQVRGGYYKLLKALKKRPLNETLFEQCMGMGYADFSNKIYAFYRERGKDNHTGPNNNWGAAEFTLPIPKGAPQPRPVFREAVRSERARMFAEWFWACKAPHLTRETFAKAEEQVPHVLDDPEFSAALGLYEARAGNKTRALNLLEKANDLKTARPAALRTLAQLRYLDIRAKKEPGAKLTQAEIKRAMAPIESALRNPRIHPKTHITFIRACRSTGIKPPERFLHKLTASCLEAPDDFVLTPVAVTLLRRCGKEDIANKVLEAASTCVLSETETELLERMREGTRLPLPPAWKNANIITE